MAGIAEARKKEIVEAVRSHLMLHGPQRMGELKNQFQDVSRATFYRLVEKARAEMENQAAAQGAGALKMAQQRIKARVETTDKVQERVKAQLPTAPSPAIVTGLGSAAGDIFDFMAYFRNIVDDADLLRSSLVTTDADGKTKVKNPVMFDRNIARRLDIIESWLHSQQLVYNLERIQELYKVVIEAVGQADPDTQRAILSRLRQLNKERGLTIGMGS